jgi:undecaprenyl pyrophosphate phosphatase UppP
MSSATLYAGYSSNSSTPATANYSFALNNPACSSAHIISLVLWSGNQTMITHWDNSTNPTSASNLINFGSVLSANNLLPKAGATSFEYYPTVLTGSVQAISAGQVYNFVIAFDNGQSISGSWIAQ